MSDLLKQINSLAIFGGIRQKEPLKSLCIFLRSTETPGTKLEDVIESYSEFVRHIYLARPDADFSGALWDSLKEDDNAYSRIVRFNKFAEQNGKKALKVSALMELEVERELEILSEIGNTYYIDLQKCFYYEGNVAQFKTTGIDMKARYLKYLEEKE